MSFDCKNTKASFNLNLCIASPCAEYMEVAVIFFPLTFILDRSNGKTLYLCVLPIIFCCRFACLKCALAPKIVFYWLLLPNWVSGCRMAA